MSLYLAAAPTREGNVELYTVLSDPRWNHSGDRVSYRLEFDEFTWTMRARGNGNDFLVLWRDIDKFLEFMEDIASQELTSLYGESGALLANFSLDGSRSATIDLEICVENSGATFGRRGFSVDSVESVMKH